VAEQPRPELRQVDDDLVLVTVGDRRVLLPAHCPHRGGLLAYGHVNVRTGRIACPLHYSVFDLWTGERVSGPACESLRVTPVEVGSPP
jgi:nitrite reductase/ring-hydroxylating ferredoxin subunit